MPVLAVDYSAINTLALCPVHELLRARHLAFCSEPGLLRALPFAFRPDHGLLGDRRLAFVHRPERSVLLTFARSCSPIARCATLCASHRSRITSCPTLDLPPLARIAPRLRLPALLCPPIARRSSLGSPCLSWIAPSPARIARTVHRLLRDRHLTFT